MSLDRARSPSLNLRWKRRDFSSPSLSLRRARFISNHPNERRDTEKAVHAKLLSVPHHRRNSFLHLVVKSGLGTMSATKRREWTFFLLSRKVGAVFQRQRNVPIPESVFDCVSQQIDEQTRELEELDAHQSEFVVALNLGLTGQGVAIDTLSNCPIESHPGALQEAAALHILREKNHKDMQN